MAVRFFDNIDVSSLNVSDIPSKSISVNFSNRGLAKVIGENSINPSTPDASNIGQIAEALADVKVESASPTGFRSLPEFVGLDYIGYIIEKHRLDKNTGDWVPIDEYWLIGSATANFKDSRIAYGNVYRYRMKSVVCVTFKKRKESYEMLEIVEDVSRQEKELIKEQLTSYLETLANIDRVTNLGLESKVSTGRATTSYDLLSNLKITATNTSTDIVKTAAEPLELDNYRRLKNLRVQDLGVVRGSISQEELQKQINSKLRTVEEDIIEYESFYYESRPSKKWLIVDVTEYKPPPPPSAIKIVPNSTKETITISWLAPANSQRDISGFKLYHRRPGIDKKWRLEKTFGVTENVYSRKFWTEPKHIFALTSVDIHGMESFLSTQIQAEFNPNYDIEKKEKDLKWISGSGAKPPEINTIFKAFLEPQDPIIATEGVKVELRPQFGEENKKLFVRITSLDTHEKKEFNLTLKNVNLNDKEE